MVEGHSAEGSARTIIWIPVDPGVETTWSNVSIGSSSTYTDVDTGTGPGDENILSYTAESTSPDDVAVSMDDDQVTMTPSLNFHGTVDIRVMVMDDGGLSYEEIFELTVNPVNDAPVINTIVFQETDEDTPFMITVSSTDEDTGTGSGDENLSMDTGNDNPGFGKYILFIVFFCRLVNTLYADSLITNNGLLFLSNSCSMLPAKELT